MAQRHISLEGFEGNVKVEKSTKGIIYADFKISKNGSYQVHLDKGTTMLVTVDVSPCRKCQLKSLRQLDLTNQIASPGAVGGPSQFSGFRAYDLDSPSSHYSTPTERVNRGFEESEEVDFEKAQLVCSDSFQAPKQRRR